jgi:hypothetical protein
MALDGTNISYCEMSQNSLHSFFVSHCFFSLLINFIYMLQYKHFIGFQCQLMLVSDDKFFCSDLNMLPLCMTVFKDSQYSF